jgi:hypothetical protein
MTTEFSNGSEILGFSLGNVTDPDKYQRISWLAERPFACQEGLCSMDSVTISLLSSVIVIQAMVLQTTTTNSYVYGRKYNLKTDINFLEKLQSDNELYATCPLAYLYYIKLLDATLNALFPLLPLPFPSFLFTIMPTCHETLCNSTQSRHSPHK